MPSEPPDDDIPARTDIGAGQVYVFGTTLRRRISANVAAFDARQRLDDGLKRAAVAVLLVDAGDGGAAMVLTRRASGLRRHSGQWALPGGRVDTGETIEQAARREIAEEIGVELPHDDVVGRLDDYPTRSGYLITPVVVWTDRADDLVANPDEVAAIHRIPLTELDRPDSPQFVANPHDDKPIIKVLIGDSQIHAPTAAVLYQFREVALHGRATRVDGYDQPEWAWR